MEHHTRRGQVVAPIEEEARARFPNLTIAFLGANRKDKPCGVTSAKVLFDGTNAIDVNTRTLLRDHQRGPVAADLKRTVCEKAKRGIHTFALTADVAEPTGRFQQPSATGVCLAAKSTQVDVCMSTQ